tara:strand:+ start:687 stop:1805 length:1119 start_codon:yes stop_codon:yes gene_type:complete
MKIAAFDLKKQYQEIKSEIDKNISKVINSGNFILGNELETFESTFASYCNINYGIGVGSGTDAIQIALKAFNIGYGDEVVTVPFTAVPTVTAIVMSGAKPTFVDVDENTRCMDSKSLRTYLEKHNQIKKVKAIIPVHLYGQAADMDEIMKIAKEFDLLVIEDASQAHGTKYANNFVGTIGNAGCFSFYPTKNLGAYGDAGMIITKEKSIANKIKKIRNYGEKEKNKNEIFGVNSRLDELQAAILNVKIKYLDIWIEKRKKIASYYDDNLKSSKIETPVLSAKSNHSYHLYVVKISNRNLIKKKLAEKGISTSIHYPLPIHLQEAFSYLGYKKNQFPNSELLSQNSLSLPMYPELTKDEINIICKNLIQLIED